MIAALLANGWLLTDAYQSALRASFGAARPRRYAKALPIDPSAHVRSWLSEPDIRLRD